MKKPICCNLYEDSILPPCAVFLNNTSPIIKDGKLIYRNVNRLFFFITLESKPLDINSDNFSDSIRANIQISIRHFIIGLFLSEIIQDPCKYDKNCVIDSDPKINSFIHKTIQNPPKSEGNFIYSISMVYSNHDAVEVPFSYKKTITLLIFTILLFLNRMEKNPGLFFINNNYATEDTFNFVLAQLHLECPMNELYNDKKN